MIADTTFLIDLLRGNERAVKFLKTVASPLKTTIINQYEVYVGLASLPGIDLEKKIKDTQHFFSRFKILPLHEDAMLEAAKICGRLIQKGEDIGDNDCLIAGIALTHGISSILTRNAKHFERIRGIKIISY
ncbi:TPA: type II toxin-antitoxin system VapC family toxin [Candidatus Woesearchaeota archaeon]|nr:type II toxin-antitoxin system VapC family toxin [Candidatus Woesearchaeota archaeon]HII69039.1 type II toxin-antitoxin system VapC family toxin [Candidatus Woesearchaeota archaeon]